MNVAIVIAIETYTDQAIPARRFADADALAFAAVLEKLGFESGDRLLLTSAEATNTIIQSKLRRALKSLDSSDTLVLYYSGHAFSIRDENFLTCHDTQASDLEGTSLSLNWLLKLLKDSDCERIVLLVDACSPALLAKVKDDVAEPFNPQPLADFVESHPQAVCLTSCALGETSQHSTKLKHGIWAHHLIEAFGGLAPTALVSDVLLTSTSLQDYLLTAVPRTLTLTSEKKPAQAPQLFAASSQPVLLADLSAVLLERVGGAALPASQIRSLSLTSQKTSLVKRLAGFNNTHRLPEQANAWAQSFVAKLAADEIEQDLAAIHAQLKKAFRFKRADLHVSEPDDDGAGTIITPYFNYSITISIDADDPSQVVWRRTVDAIKEPSQIVSAPFDSVFGKTFEAVEFTTAGPIDLPALIDRIEEQDDERIAIDYENDCSACTVRIRGLAGTIQVTPRSITVLHPRATSPRELLQSFVEMQQVLAQSHDVRLIP